MPTQMWNILVTTGDSYSNVDVNTNSWDVIQVLLTGLKLFWMDVFRKLFFFFSVYVIKHVGSDVKLIFGFLTTLIVKFRNVEDLV